jgi:hypothetical protein
MKRIEKDGYYLCFLRKCLPSGLIDYSDAEM